MDNSTPVSAKESGYEIEIEVEQKTPDSDSAVQPSEQTDSPAPQSVATATESGDTRIVEYDDRTLVERIPNPLRHPIRCLVWIVRNLFGITSLAFLLAVIAAIPIVNFLALGYLLAVEGRMARSGKLRYAFPLLKVAPRLGCMAIGIWLWVLPVRLFSSLARDAEIIDAGSAVHITVTILSQIFAVLVAIHIVLALARGGALSCFFRPLKNLRWLLAQLRAGEYWAMADETVRQFIRSLELKHHFSLGFRGFFGAAIWLVVPTALFSVLNDTDNPGQVIISLIGGVWLLVVLAWMPFLQANFAAENRFRAMFELGRVREQFKRTPLVWFITVVLVYTMALPLYLFKIVLPPQDAMWGITLVFITTIYPAKVLTGWAVYRARSRTKRSFLLWHWFWRLTMVPLIGLYVFLLFFTPAIGEHGKGVLFEHHAFLLPVPF